jgi:hypothetical protein
MFVGPRLRRLLRNMLLTQRGFELGPSLVTEAESREESRLEAADGMADRQQVTMQLTGSMIALAAFGIGTLDSTVVADMNRRSKLGGSRDRSTAVCCARLQRTVRSSTQNRDRRGIHCQRREAPRGEGQGARRHRRQ